jgi:hypothetical protein
LKHNRDQSSADKKFEHDIEQIITLDKNGNVEALDRLGKFLNTPVENLNINPLGVSASVSNEEKTIGIALNVLALILRFFIRI